MTDQTSSPSFLGKVGDVFTSGLNAVIDAEVSHIASPDQGQPGVATPAGQAPSLQGTANHPGLLSGSGKYLLLGGAAVALVVLILVVRR